jgi:hypothetical protein
MNKIKATARKVTNHVSRNRWTYVASSVAALAILLQQANNRAFQAFLIEKGIDPLEYYCPELLEELNS